MGSNQQPQDYDANAFPTELRREIYRFGFRLLLYSVTLYNYNVTPHCITTRLTSCIEHVSWYCSFIKSENIAVDEIGIIICPRLLAQAHTYFI